MSSHKEVSVCGNYAGSEFFYFLGAEFGAVK